MPKDCVLNELSFRLLDERSHDLVSLLVQLAEIFRTLGPDAQIWACLRHSDHTTPAGRGLQLCRRAVFDLRHCDDRRRRAARFLQRIQPFPPNAELDASHDLGRARGLGRAHQLSGLALSLDVAPWHNAWIDIEVDTLIGETIARSRLRVMHATRKEHLLKHSAWVALADADRLRILLGIVGATHTPASSYRKHVRGTTNAERQDAASQPTAPGQYLAEITGTRVTDETIASWERGVLGRVVDGHPGRIRVEMRRPSEYHVYCECDHDVGYATGGNVTRWMRVEWKEGHVHSHPRPASAE